jgi:hypothetical protein
LSESRHDAVRICDADSEVNAHDDIGVEAMADPARFRLADF